MHYFFFKARRECDRGHLQLSGSHFENELHHRADSETSRTGGVDLVPNSVAVHLQNTRDSLLKLDPQSKEDYRLELYLSAKETLLFVSLCSVQQSFLIHINFPKWPSRLAHTAWRHCLQNVINL